MVISKEVAKLIDRGSLMNELIDIHVCEMTATVMKILERKGIIFLLSPDHYELHPPEGEVGVKTVYESDIRFGSHMLIAATINRTEFSAFGTHPDNEEVLLIGSSETKPCYFLFALSDKWDMENKVKNRTLSDKDFVAVKAKYNDPYMSFFTILKDIPHGEVTIKGPGEPPSFYVTEQTNLPLEIFNFGHYKIDVRE